MIRLSRQYLAPCVGALVAMNAGAACTTSHNYPFAITNQVDATIVQVGLGVQQAPLSYDAALTIDATIRNDVIQSAAAGCRQYFVQSAHGEVFYWNEAQGRYDVRLDLIVARPSTGVQRVLRTWTDADAIGPVLGGSDIHHVDYSHTYTVNLALRLLGRVGDVISWHGAGQAAAEGMTDSNFNQAYSQYTFGNALEVPSLVIELP